MFVYRSPGTSNSRSDTLHATFAAASLKSTSTRISGAHCDVGIGVGACVGSNVVGVSEGCVVGVADGVEVVGDAVGNGIVGSLVDGADVGAASVGDIEGCKVGTLDDGEVLGA